MQTLNYLSLNQLNLVTLGDGTAIQSTMEKFFKKRYHLSSRTWSKLYHVRTNYDSFTSIICTTL